MASSQIKPTKSDPEKGPRNPLRLRKPKLPISPAEGHVFDGNLTCGHCGRTWNDQRIERTTCGSETVAPPDSEPSQDT